MRLPVQWLTLVLASAGAAVLLSRPFPGAYALVGPMLIGTVFGFCGSKIVVPHKAILLAQALTGCAVASSIRSEDLASAAASWWQLLLVVILTLAGALAIGAALLRFGTLPGTTGAWGSLPGGAPAMATLAEQNGGNGVIVSVMQYLRVGVVVWITSVVAHGLVAEEPASSSTSMAAASSTIASAVSISELAWVIGVSLAGIWLAGRFRVAAGALLIPVLLGTAINVMVPGLLRVPPALLILSFALIGWSVGLQFRGDSTRVLLINFPLMMAAIAALIGICSLCAWLLTAIMPVNGVTAYLATAPGGLDTIAAIAMGTPSDMAIVTATHTLRLLVVVMFGPYLVNNLSALIVRKD